MPVDIDMDGIKKFIYEMNFAGKKVKGLGVEGYYHAAYPYLKSLTTDLLYGPSAAVTNGSVLFCVACTTAVITVDGIEKTFQALGSCGSNESRVKPEFMASVAETRAIKQVLHRALDLTRFDICDIDIDDVDSNGGDSAPVKPYGNVSDLSVPAAVASGEAGSARRSKLPSSDDGSAWS
jgi:hypothetical protein